MANSATFAVLNIGDELLLGLRENSHLPYLAQVLSRHGGEIVDCRIVRDRTIDIVDALRGVLARADVVLITGGLGPTSDDLTREAVAEFLGSRLVFDETVESTIRDRFQRLNRSMTENNLRQCQRPEEAEVIPNRNGTAPGLKIERDGKTLFLLPGPEGELKPMFEEQVVPDLEKTGHLGDNIGFLQMRVCGLGESAVEQRLSTVVDRHPNVLFAYCAHGGIVDVRVSARNDRVTTADINRVGEECRLTLGNNLYGFGEDSLAKILVLQLRCWDRTLAVAESCTGGLLASAFTDIPGASKVFLGSVVAYTNEAKIQMLDVPECLLQQHGAVSGEAAVAMATGAAEKFSADYALSVTGFAGPGGGSGDNPVGTVYMAHFSPSGVWSRRSVYPGDRLQIKQRAVVETLDWARRTLERYKVEDFLISGV